jgi:predicted regulator of Ras-like GTPase activity (Roadblock/LC7/MglB family)
MADGMLDLSIQEALDTFVREADVRGVQLIERSGVTVATSGDLLSVDPTSLGSVAAGNMSSAAGLARLVGTDPFSFVLLEGPAQHAALLAVHAGVFLLVLFDQRSNAGVVRWRGRRLAVGLAHLLGGAQKSAARVPISDEEIDELFAH